MPTRPLMCGHDLPLDSNECRREKDVMSIIISSPETLKSGYLEISQQILMANE